MFDAMYPDTVLFTDGARAYRVLVRQHHIAFHDYVHHGRGQFTKRAWIACRRRCVSTNGLEGLWGRLKTWLRSKGGVNRTVAAEYVLEYEWRVNTAGRDRFFEALSAVAMVGMVL